MGVIHMSITRIRVSVLALSVAGFSLFSLAGPSQALADSSWDHATANVSVSTGSTTISTGLTVTVQPLDSSWD